MPEETAITLPIRMVLFDYGNVLEFVDHRRSAARLCEGTGRDAGELLRRFLVPRGPLEQLESGMIDADGFRRLASEAIGREFSPDEFAARFSDMFVMREDTLELLRALRGRYRLGLLSNTNEIHHATTISKHPCFGFFDQVTLSFEVKAMKPSPAIYLDALAKAAGIPPAGILYLDDIPAYAEAARACGMQALVYDPAGTTATTVRRLLTGS